MYFWEVIRLPDRYNIILQVLFSTKIWWKNKLFHYEHICMLSLIHICTVLKQVSSFEYLGYSVSYNACNDMVHKLDKFNLMCETIRRTLKSASKGTCLNFFKTVALPTLLYGSENWTLTKGQPNRIQAAEMRFLRHVAGYTLHDHRRNTGSNWIFWVYSVSYTHLRDKKKFV